MKLEMLDALDLQSYLGFHQFLQAFGQISIFGRGVEVRDEFWNHGQENTWVFITPGFCFSHNCLLAILVPPIPLIFHIQVKCFIMVLIFVFFHLIIIKHPKSYFYYLGLVVLACFYKNLTRLR
jgi:hypothetical protein